MKKLKTYLLPSLIVLVGLAVFILLNGDEAPVAAAKPVKLPLVKIHKVEKAEMALGVESYGRLSAKEHTSLVGEVQGKITFISEAFNAGAIVNKGDLLSKIDDVDYKVAVLRAEAQLVKAKAEYEIVLAQSRVAKKEWQDIKGEAPALALYQPQLQRELASIKAAEAELEQAKRNLGKTRIYAPYNAVVERREVGIGQHISYGDVMGSIIGTDVAELRLAVSNADMARLGDAVGKNVVLEGKGTSGKRLAVIRRNEAIIATNTAINYLVAEITDPLALEVQEQPLKFGEFVNAWIESRGRTELIRLPSDLVRNDRVWLMDAASKLHQQQVEVTQHIDGWAIIKTGLKEGDKVLTTRMAAPVEGMLVEEMAEQALVTRVNPDKGEF